MNFAPFNAHTASLFRNCNILKFNYIINTESCIFVKKCFDSNAFPILAESFKLASATHKYNTGSARNGLLFVTSYNSVTFGRKSIHSTALIRNYLHDKLVVYDFLILTPKSFKSLSSNVFISTYDS